MRKAENSPHPKQVKSYAPSPRGRGVEIKRDTLSLWERVRVLKEWGEGFLLVFFVLTFGFTPVFAASTSVDTSRIAVGARSLAMGRVSAAAPGDINSLFINPANAAALENWGATSMYTSLLEGDISYTMIGGAKAKAVFGGTLGLAYLGGSSAGLNVTTIDADSRVVPTGSSFDYSNSTITVAYGKSLRPNLDVGGSVKLLNKSFGSQGSGSGYAVDLGLLFGLRDNLNLGLAVQNAVSGLNWSSANESLPLGIKGGLNFQPRENILIAADTDLTPMALHAGVEWKPMTLLAVRGGMERVPTGNSSAVIDMTAGIGLDLKGVMFDYAYFNDGALAANSTHYFTISFLPPTTAAAKPAEKPAVQTVITPAPTAPTPVIAPAPAAKKPAKKAPAKKPAPVKKPAPTKKR